MLIYVLIVYGYFIISSKILVMAVCLIPLGDYLYSITGHLARKLRSQARSDKESTWSARTQQPLKCIHSHVWYPVSKICILDGDCEINPTDLIVNFNRRDLAMLFTRLHLYLERRDLNGIDLIIWIDVIINLLSKLSYNNHNIPLYSLHMINSALS